MPKGNATRVDYDESDYGAQTACGFYAQGRPSLIRLKLKLHKAKCPTCSQFEGYMNMDEMTHDSFKAMAPDKKINGRVLCSLQLLSQ